jgi:hypothetical protein
VQDINARQQCTAAMQPVYLGYEVVSSLLKGLIRWQGLPSLSSHDHQQSACVPSRNAALDPNLDPNLQRDALQIRVRSTACAHAACKSMLSVHVI